MGGLDLDLSNTNGRTAGRFPQLVYSERYLNANSLQRKFPTFRFGAVVWLVPNVCVRLVLGFKFGLSFFVVRVDQHKAPSKEGKQNETTAAPDAKGQNQHPREAPNIRKTKPPRNQRQTQRANTEREPA